MRAGEALSEEEALTARHVSEPIPSLVGVLAHELNNMLTVIIGCAELASDELDEAAPVRLCLERLLGVATGARDLVQRALPLARGLRQALADVDVREVVDSTCAAWRSQLPSHIELLVERSPVPALVRVDQTAIAQVLLNLLANAADAIGSVPGRIAVTTSVAGRKAVLRVRDTGTGMTDEVRSRVFEAFFTTKPPASGTGLGLAIVHSIVAGHGGTIELETAPGAGCVLTVALPLAAPEPLEHADRRLARAHAAGRSPFGFRPCCAGGARPSVTWRVGAPAARAHRSFRARPMSRPVARTRRCPGAGPPRPRDVGLRSSFPSLCTPSCVTSSWHGSRPHQRDRPEPHR